MAPIEKKDNSLDRCSLMKSEIQPGTVTICSGESELQSRPQLMNSSSRRYSEPSDETQQSKIPKDVLKLKKKLLLMHGKIQKLCANKKD